MTWTSGFVLYFKFCSGPVVLVFMRGCPELSKLSKSPQFTSILWRHQTPGSISSLLSGSLGPDLLDVSHPAAGLRASSFPKYNGKDINIKIFPMALLQRPVNSNYPFRRRLLTWTERVKKVQQAGVVAVENKRKEPKLFWKSSGQQVGLEQNYFEDEADMVKRIRFPECRAMPKGMFLRDVVAVAKAKRRIPMSYLTVTSKVRMGAKRCSRRTITLRIKAALNLIVAKGAYYGDWSKRNSGYVQEIDGSASESSGAAEFASTMMKFDEEEAKSMGRKWILQDWSYVFSPNLEVYRMPYWKLIPILRESLTTLYAQAVEMENKWLATSLLREQQKALKSTIRRSGLHDVRRPDDLQPQISISNNTRTLATLSHNKTNTQKKYDSSFEEGAWRGNLEAEMQLLAQFSKVKP